MKILKELCELFGPSGEERAVRDYILDHVHKNSSSWKIQPELYYGDEFQDCLILQFGHPKVAAFAHMDTIGYTVRYEDQLVPIGGPHAENGALLRGEDPLGEIECSLIVAEDHHLKYNFGRPIQTGTSLVYKVDFRETDETIQSAYLDNRLGVYTLLQLAKTMENGLLVFSCWEEHGGESVPYLAKFIHEKWKITKSLVADITWITDGVKPGEGVVISLRDHNIPRRTYLTRIIEIVERSGIPYQFEVEASGSSDARELQLSPYPIDWCFIGAAEEKSHTPDEIVQKKDIDNMIDLYKVLMKEL